VNKEAPGLGRILVIAGFALSCFGLLLFLWLAFGGPVPFKPKGYQVTVAFDDAATLAEQADVRISGVSVGKVVTKGLAPEGNRSLATIEIEPRFAPLRTDTRAILRQKTLLGETYVELTPGSKAAPRLQDGARLPDSRVQPAVEFDELLRIFDPETRRAFQQWQQSTAEATGGQGRDLSDALGSLQPFVSDAQDVDDVLDTRRAELRGLVRGTGQTFEAITRDEAALATLIQQQRTVFGELSDKRESLAQTFEIIPTFLRESRATLSRTSSFARRTDPLLRELEPVLEDIGPTLASLREASPALVSFFGDIPELAEAGRTGLPALSRVLTSLEPTLAEIGRFLEQLNPVLQYLEQDQATLADFLNTGPSAFGLQVDAPPGQSKTNGHALPQVLMTGSQSLPSQTRSPDNRGNAYLRPGALARGLGDAGRFILPSWDCNNAGGPAGKPPTDTPGCFVQEPVPFQGENQRYPHVEKAGASGTLQDDEQPAR
jgi:phospholipid/cholesterol/gamma-HCH transport system substrate-binding protein